MINFFFQECFSADSIIKI